MVIIYLCCLVLLKCSSLVLSFSQISFRHFLVTVALWQKANLYARSIFGEDALANVSIEKPIQQGPEAPVTGHIRIRAKSQVTDK